MLLFSVLAIVIGCNSYRCIVTFIDVHRHRLNAAIAPSWRRARAHAAIRFILQGFAVEAAFPRHATLLHAACATPGKGSIGLDGKTLRGSFDNFHDRAAAGVLSASATDTALVLAHTDIAEKSREIPTAQVKDSQPTLRQRIKEVWVSTASLGSVSHPSNFVNDTDEFRPCRQATIHSCAGPALIT
ncbi:MAG: hypothetical protein JOY66_19600 [Acetobacteraceae bacterium]|nr:hypothetical protein [Acetobacteraceae bacterium]